MFGVTVFSFNFNKLKCNVKLHRGIVHQMYGHRDIYIICIRNAFHFIYNLTKFTPFQPRQRMLARRWLIRCYEILM